MKKCFEYKNGKSAKFWNITVKEETLTVTYGKIGTKGQTKKSEFDDIDQCHAHAEKLMGEKLKKGYVQVECPQVEIVTVDSFITDYLRQTVVDTNDKVTALEIAINIPLSSDARKLMAALYTHEEGINFSEWRVSSNELVSYGQGKINAVEQLILSDQKNYLGTALVEMFSNTAYIGSLGNGDLFMLSLDRFEEEPCVVQLDHECYDMDLVFADSVQSFLRVVCALEDYNANIIGEEEVSQIVASVDDKVNLSWHYGELSKCSDTEPSYEDCCDARFLMFRAIWVIYLLKNDKVHDLKAVARQFNLVERDIENYNDFIEAFGSQSPSSATYWLWHFFFFDKPDYLQRMMQQLKEHPSILVRDTISLINEFLAGRKKLGKIKDIFALRKAFLDLDLDPEREAERIQEQKQAEMEARRQKNQLLDGVQKDMEAITTEALPELAWKYIEEKAAVEYIYDSLRQRTRTYDLGFARFDYVKEGKFSRDGKYFDFEREEVLEALMLDNPEMAPLLCVNGYPVRDQRVAPFLKGQLSGGLDDLPRDLLTTLQHVPAPEFQAYLLGCIPEPVSETADDDQLMDYHDALETLYKLCPLFAAHKNHACVKPLLSHVKALTRITERRGDYEAVRAKRYLNELIPSLIATFGEIGGNEAVDFLRECLKTRHGAAAEQALIERGDDSILPYLMQRIENLFGVPEKTCKEKVRLAYAMTKADMKPELESSRFALFTEIPGKGESTQLHKMALEVLIQNGEPETVRPLIVPFLDHESETLRNLVCCALESWEEEVTLAYMDRAHVDDLFSRGGRDALIPYLVGEYSVFKYNILRKLADENTSDGIEEQIIEQGRRLTRFEYYGWNYSSDCYHADNYAIYALAGMKNPRIDDFVHSLMGHPSVVYRENDLFKYKNYTHSDYLRQLMEEPSILRKPLFYSESEIKELTVTFMNDSSWNLGTPVYGVAVSQTDGSIAVTGDTRTAVFNGDGSMRHELNAFDRGYDCKFSPDGRYIATGYHNGKLCLYDAANGNKVRDMTGHKRSYYGVKRVAFSPDGTLLASGSDDKTLRIWDVETGAEVECHTFTTGVRGVGWLPNQKRLVACTMKGVEIFERDEQTQRLKARVDNVADVCIFEENGKVRIATDGDAFIHIFDEELNCLKKLKQKDVCRIRVSADNSTLYAASWDSNDRGISMWNLTSDRRRTIKETKGQAVQAMDVNSVTGKVVMGFSGGVLATYDKASGYTTCTGVVHEEKLETIAYNPINKRLYSMDKRGCVLEWDESTCRSIYKPSESTYAKALEVSWDGKQVFVGMKETIAAIDLATGDTQIFTTAERCQKIVSLSGEHTYALTGNQVLNLTTGQLSEEADGSLHSMAVCGPEKKLYAAGFLEREIYRFSLPQMTIDAVYQEPVAGTHGVYNFSSACHNGLYCSGADGCIRRHDAATYEMTALYHMENSCDHVAVTADGDQIAATSGHNLLILNRGDGTVLAEQDFGSKLIAMCVGDAGECYVATENGGIYRCAMNQFKKAKREE